MIGHVHNTGTNPCFLQIIPALQPQHRRSKPPQGPKNIINISLKGCSISYNGVICLIPQSVPVPYPPKVAAPEPSYIL